MTQPRSRVDLYAAIRRDARSGMSNRALQRKHGVGFRTVTAALESAWPKERKQPPKRGSRIDAYRVVIDDWLRSSDAYRPFEVVQSGRWWSRSVPIVRVRIAYAAKK